MISMISIVHKRSRLIVIQGFKINLDLRTYGNSNQLLQVKLKLLHVAIISAEYNFIHVKLDKRLSLSKAILDNHLIR